MNQGSFKDFEEVRLKATYNIELGDRSIEEGETILYFDKIQIAGLHEIIERVSANGGFDNRAHVYWETTKEIQLQFSQGVFSKEQFALMSNSKLVVPAAGTYVTVTGREHLELDENSQVTLKHTPAHLIFVYNVVTGAKMEFIQSGNVLTIDSTPYTEVIVDYEWDYSGDSQYVQIGKRFLTGFVSLEGKTRVKDDTTGQIVTGLLVIPRLRLMSDLSMRLGAQANPVVASFNAVGVPVGSRTGSYVSEFYYLGDDINSDL